MKSIETYFEEVSTFYGELSSKSTDTIHTDSYEETAREIYADWQQVKISLKPLIEGPIIEEFDECFNSLLRESRKSRSSVNKSVNHLREIEDLYIEHVYPEISHREIEAGFVNSLVAELEQIQNDKYHEYLEEAVQCVQAGAYRGAVVLGWQAAMYALYKELENQDEPLHVSYERTFNTTPDFRIESFWDFQKMKDENILILSEGVGIIDKSMKDMMVREKDIRNKAAHPGIYDVGPNGTKALLEGVIQLLVELDL